MYLCIHEAYAHGCRKVVTIIATFYFILLFKTCIHAFNQVWQSNTVRHSGGSRSTKYWYARMNILNPASSSAIVLDTIENKYIQESSRGICVSISTQLFVHPLLHLHFYRLQI